MLTKSKTNTEHCAIRPRNIMACYELKTGPPSIFIVEHNKIWLIFITDSKEDLSTLRDSTRKELKCRSDLHANITE